MALHACSHLLHEPQEQDGWMRQGSCIGFHRYYDNQSLKVQMYVLNIKVQRWLRSGLNSWAGRLVLAN